MLPLNNGKATKPSSSLSDYPSQPFPHPINSLLRPANDTKKKKQQLRRDQNKPLFLATSNGDEKDRLRRPRRGRLCHRRPRGRRPGSFPHQLVLRGHPRRRRRHRGLPPLLLRLLLAVTSQGGGRKGSHRCLRSISRCICALFLLCVLLAPPVCLLSFYVVSKERSDGIAWS
ncbi:hypothetical protein B296_00016842 [Ensete ventricosum]|uniref:Uncharacterized protein n=1 Tax=Ensete ventricosum TaxID=4639 RepID=A0A427A0E0_ENSVE|nr:hypothetical protein B296_00016842 [Ensete ventricosum]